MDKVAFIWQDGPRYDWIWDDGLYVAMRILESYFDVQYFVPGDEAIKEFKPDIALFWGAAIDRNVPWVQELTCKKAILFGGGPINADLVRGWDMVFVESQLDYNIVASQSPETPLRRAFGINEALFHPTSAPKAFQALMAGTFAAWKRHNLFAHAVGPRGLAIGIKQPHESWCYEVCERAGVKVLEEASRSEIAGYINQSEVILNTADRWGGGQRLTLEAMACNVPPIVMSDAPKNIEFVYESGYGIVCEPDPQEIQLAVQKAKNLPPLGRDYIMAHWTSTHYANALKDGIEATLGTSQR